MTAGKTGEKIVESGKYYCSRHNNVIENLSLGDTFPKCSEDHEAIWISADKGKSDLPEPPAPDTGSAQPVNPAPEQSNGETPKPGFDNKPALAIYSSDKTYKKVGFFAAVHHVNYPIAEEYKLSAILLSEKDRSNKEIEALRLQYKEKLDVIKKEFEIFVSLLEEKERMKTEFKEVLSRMNNEHADIIKEINEYNKHLREEIKSLGLSKENLISKRIEEFEKEINKTIEIYQNIENKQNDKFRKDFNAKNVQDKDKKFYYEYRDNLEKSFSDIEQRLIILRGEGLSEIAAHFLIIIGWLSAFVTSWFFCLWYSGDSSSSVLVYILDNLRNFVLKYDWKVSLSVFLGYISGIMLISWLCYKALKTGNFLKKKNGKKSDKKTEEESDIEFSVDKEIEFKSKFRAETVYEMWLKITPFLAIVLFLIIILALGSGNGPAGSYNNLSNALFVQVIGLMLPLSATILGFLYIIRFIERKNESQGKKGGWEIPFTVILFFVLVALLIADKFLPGLADKRLIGAWGFLTGTTCTSLSLGFAYRFSSLTESSYTLGAEINAINKFINNTFYPWDVSYLKYSGIVQRMRNLYHSLLTLSESRNDLALKLLNLHYLPQPVENNINAEEAEDQQEEIEGDDAKKQPEEAEEDNTLKTRLLNLFKKSERKLKRKLRDKEKTLKAAENTIEELKKDTVTIDELIYFPVQAAKIKEIKVQIIERTRRREELKAEVEGYYNEGKTYASLDQQIKKINDRRVALASNIANIDSELLDKIKKIQELYIQRQIAIQEGYQVGLWFRNNPGNDSIHPNENNLN